MSQSYLPTRELPSPRIGVDPTRSSGDLQSLNGAVVSDAGTLPGVGRDGVLVAQVITPVRPVVRPVSPGSTTLPGTAPGGNIPGTNIPSAFPGVGNGSAQTYATSFGRGLAALRNGYFSGQNLASITLEALANTFEMGRIPLDVQNRMTEIVRAHGDTIRGTNWWSQAAKDEFNARIGAALALYEEGSLSAQDLLTTAGEALTDINGREERRDIAARRELYRDAPTTGRPTTGQPATSQPSQTYGPGDAQGVADAQAAQQRARAAQQQALDNASRSTPIPGTDVAKTSYAGFTWEQAQQAARDYNNGRSDGTIAVPVSYERQYRTDSGTQTRREPTVFVGSPVDILNEVARDRQAGRIPAGFDPAGQARQVGVPNWDQMLAADVANRAFATESNNPTRLHGNTVGTFPTAGEAIRWAQANNAAASGADSVALAVPLRVGVTGPGIDTAANVETVYLGSPDQLRSFYDTMRQQGRIAPGTSFESLLDRSGIAGSYAGRRQAALDLRAMAAEQASPTTLFDSTVGVHPGKGSATNAAVAANAGTSGADMVTLYVPLEREIDTDGARGTGIAHTLYRNDPTKLRGFYDEMVRQGRIPDGVTFESLLADSGLSGSFQGRLDAANANDPERRPPSEPGIDPSRRNEPMRVHPIHPRPTPPPNEGPVPPDTPLIPYNPTPNPPPRRPEPESTGDPLSADTINTPPAPAFPAEVPVRPRPVPSDAPVTGDPASDAPVGNPVPTDGDLAIEETTPGGTYPFEVTVPEEFRRANEEAERIYREIAGRPADPLGGGDRDAEIERRIEELRHTDPAVALALEGIYYRNKRPVPGGSPTAATSTGGAGDGTGNNRPTAANFEDATPEEIGQMPIGDLGRWAEYLDPDAVYDMEPAKRAAILDRLMQGLTVENGTARPAPGVNGNDARAAWAGIDHFTKAFGNVAAERAPAPPTTLIDPNNPLPQQQDQPPLFQTIFPGATLPEDLNPQPANDSDPDNVGEPEPDPLDAAPAAQTERPTLSAMGEELVRQRLRQSIEENLSPSAPTYGFSRDSIIEGRVTAALQHVRDLLPYVESLEQAIAIAEQRLGIEAQGISDDVRDRVISETNAINIQRNLADDLRQMPPVTADWSVVPAPRGTGANPFEGRLDFVGPGEYEQFFLDRIDTAATGARVDAIADMVGGMSPVQREAVGFYLTSNVEAQQPVDAVGVASAAGLTLSDAQRSGIDALLDGAHEPHTPNSLVTRRLVEVIPGEHLSDYDVDYISRVIIGGNSDIYSARDEAAIQRNLWGGGSMPDPENPDGPPLPRVAPANHVVLIWNLDAQNDRLGFPATAVVRPYEGNGRTPGVSHVSQLQYVGSGARPDLGPNSPPLGSERFQTVPGGDVEAAQIALQLAVDHRVTPTIVERTGSGLLGEPDPLAADPLRGYETWPNVAPPAYPGGTERQQIRGIYNPTGVPLRGYEPPSEEHPFGLWGGIPGDQANAVERYAPGDPRRAGLPDDPSATVTTNDPPFDVDIQYGEPLPNNRQIMPGSDLPPATDVPPATDRGPTGAGDGREGGSTGGGSTETGGPNGPRTPPGTPVTGRFGTPGDEEILRRVQIQEAGAAWANPVTNSVYNAAFLTDTALSEKAAGRDIAVLLADSNNFSIFDRLVGNAGGDLGIELTSQAMNRVAARLNELYADQGIFFLPGRLAGDEMYLLAVIDPARSGGMTQMPNSVPLDMVRIFHEEIAVYNATHDMPIPTGTSSAAVVTPDSYEGAHDIGTVFDRLDHLGSETLNQGDSSPFFKNGGVAGSDGVITIIPGATYPDNGGRLRNFRNNQGQLPDPDRAYAEAAPNVVTITPEGVFARPQVLPDAVTGPDIPRVELPPTQLTEALGDGPVVDSINHFRNIQPIESVFRRMIPEGIRIYTQPVGLAHLDYAIKDARANGGNIFMEYMEPRGISDVNKIAYINLNGLPVPVSHGGGDVLIDAMVRANHQALEEVLEPGYEDRGEAFVFRDRGKRFGVIYGPTVSEENIRDIQDARDRIYRAMPAMYRIPNEGDFQIYMPDDAGGHELVFNLGYAAVRIQPSEFPQETAETLRDRLVTPIRPGTESVLEIGKNNSDGIIAPIDLIPEETDELEFWISPSRRRDAPR